MSSTFSLIFSNQLYISGKMRYIEFTKTTVWHIICPYGISGPTSLKIIVLKLEVEATKIRQYDLVLF